MASERWVYVAQARQYRDATTGRFLPAATVAQLRDEFTTANLANVTRLAARLALGEIDVRAWEQAMRALVRAVFLGQYALGRGGIGALQTVDRMRVGALVGEQWGFLHAFAAEVAAGDLSEAQIAARSQLYVESSARAESEGHQRAFRGLELPAHPGDGSTACRSQCRCRWSIVDDGDEWRATWRTGGGDATCADCRRRGADWSPLVVVKT